MISNLYIIQGLLKFCSKKHILLFIAILCIQYISFSQNLILNGSAENATAGEIDDWVEVLGTDWISKGEVPPQDGGKHFFPRKSPTPLIGPDPSVEIAELRQDVDVSTYNTSIDAGIQDFAFAGYTRTWKNAITSDPLDDSEFILEMYDASMNLLSNWTSGKQSSIGSTNTAADGWLLSSVIITAPIGTRIIRVRLLATRNYGDDNDGYFDNLGLTPVCVAGTASLNSSMICEGDSTTLTIDAYTGAIQWQQSINNGTTWTNVGPADNSSSIKISSSFVNSPTLYRAEVTSLFCTEYSSTASLTINEKPTIGSLTANKTTLCEGESLLLSLASGTGTYTWEKSNNGGVFTSFGNTNATQADSPSLLNSPVDYRLVSTIGSCTDTSNEVSVTIQSAPVGGSTNASQTTICEGETSTLNLNSSTGNIQWQTSTDGTTWTDFGSGTSIETVSPLFTNSPSQYRAELTTGSCTDYSTISTITINEKPVSGISSSSKSSLCAGETTTISLASNTGSIQWQDSSSLGTWTNIGSGASSFTPSLSPSNSPVTYRAITTIGTCYDTSNTSNVTIFPNAVGGTPSTPTTSICDGETTTLSLTGSSGVIQWQERINAGTWTDFGSGSLNESILPTTANSPIEYRALLTAGSCSDISSTYTLTVNPAPLPGNNTISSTTLCEGGTEQLTLSGETGTIQWQQQVNNGTWSNFGSGTNTQDISPSATDVTVNYRAYTTLGSCSDTSTSTTINIYQNATGGTLTVPTNTLCEGETTTLTLTGSTGSIQWQQKANSGTWTNFGGPSTTETITPTLANSPIIYRAMLTSGICIDSSSEQPITVTSTPTGGTTSALNNNLCEGETTTIAVTGNSGSILWQDSIAGGTWTDLGITSSSFTSNTSYPTSTVSFRSIANSGSCYDTSSIIPIMINPTPIAGTASLSAYTICESDSTKLELTGNTGTSKWQASLNNTTWFDIPPSTTDSITSVATASPTYIRSMATSGTCTDSTDVIQLTIISPPTTGSITINDTLCHNEDATVSITGNSHPVQWQQSLNGSPYSNYGSGNTAETINHTATENPISYKAIISNGTCERSIVSPTTIVVEPIGGFVSLNDLSICDGSSTTLSLTGETGTSIQWQRAINGGSFSDFGGNASSLLVSPSLTDVSVEYQAIVYLGTTCNATSTPETLTISQPAQAGNLSIADDTICNGSSSILNLTGYLGNITWESTTDTTNWVTVAPGSDNESIAPNFIDSPTYYRAVVKNGNCTDTTSTDSLFIAIVDGGTISSTDLTICSGNNATLSLTGEIGSIQWQQVLANGNIIDLPSTTNNISVSPTTADSPAQYRASIKQANCTDFSNPLTITIDTVPPTIPTINGVDTICGTELASFSITPLTNATSYVWTSNTGTIITNGNTLVNVTLTNNDNNTAQINVFGQNNCGDGASTNFNYVILSTPNPSITTPDSVICEDQSITLFVGELNGTPTNQLNYEWFIDGTAIPNSNNNSITQQVEGNYTVTLSNRNHCKTQANNSTQVSIFEMEVDAGNELSISHGESISLEASSSGNFTYEWSPNSLIDDNNILTPIVRPTETTQYTLTATSSNGCIDTSSTTIFVNQKITIPNAFSPNGDGINDDWTIENINQWAPVQVSIFNRWGGLLYETYNEYTPWDGKRNGASLPVGTYYYIIKVSSDEVYTGALTITR